MESEKIILEVIKGLSIIASTSITVLGGIKLKNKNNDNDKNKVNRSLLHHPIFSRIELNKTFISNHFTLNNKGKELVFKEMLLSHLEIYEKNIRNLCNEIEKYNNSEKDENYNNLSFISANYINKIMIEVSSFYKNTDKYTVDEVKVFSIVSKIYNKWNKNRYEDIITLASSISSSVFYPNTYAKTIAILDILMFVINDTIIDAGKTLNELNGDLKGLKFKSVVI